MEYRYQNYQQMAPYFYQDMKIRGISNESRNGPVLRLPGVNTFVVDNPWERVSTCPIRDANPFFHLIEAMAMLAGLNDAPFMAHFAKNMLSFSDDGEHYNAFYGTRILHRWFDQLSAAIEELEINPETRQCVVQIWDPNDLTRKTKDKACNLMLLFSVVNGKLEMTSFNRSNDAVWGIISGANIVHLSYFQEYVACALGLPMGPWSHVSNNVHVYMDNPKTALLLEHRELYDVYDAQDLEYGKEVRPLFTRMGGTANHLGFRAVLYVLLRWMQSVTKSLEPFSKLTLNQSVQEAVQDFPFLMEVVVPVFNSWQAHKAGQKEEALGYAGCIRSADWRAACNHWLQRRYTKEDSK